MRYGLTATERVPSLLSGEQLLSAHSQDPTQGFFSYLAPSTQPQQSSPSPFNGHIRFSHEDWIQLDISNFVTQYWARNKHIVECIARGAQNRQFSNNAEHWEKQICAQLTGL